MRKLQDSHFEKGKSPLEYHKHIWWCWLNENSNSESEHFITSNTYTCIELNAHLVLNIVYDVIAGKYPKEAFISWTTGSQSCLVNNFFVYLGR